MLCMSLLHRQIICSKYIMVSKSNWIYFHVRRDDLSWHASIPPRLVSPIILRGESNKQEGGGASTVSLGEER